MAPDTSSDQRADYVAIVALALETHAYSYPNGFRPGAVEWGAECPWEMDELSWPDFARSVVAALAEAGALIDGEASAARQAAGASDLRKREET